MSDSTAVQTYRALFAHAHHEWMEGTMADVSAEDAAWRPPGRLSTIGGLYAHAVLSEDVLLAMGVGAPPLVMSSHKGVAGIDSLPPLGNWHDWSLAVQVDLPALRNYAAATFAATDERLAALGDGDLDRMVDLTAMKMSVMPLAALLQILVCHVSVHAGEISAVKGLMDRKGYPI